LLPKFSREFERLNIEASPPSLFITSLMKLPVMPAAEWHRELIADFEAQGTWLGEAQMMRITGMTSAHNARLGGDKSKMGFVAPPFWFGQGEGALVDLFGTYRSNRWRCNRLRC